MKRWQASCYVIVGGRGASAHCKYTLRRTNEPSRLPRLSRSSRHDDDNWKSSRNKVPRLQGSMSAIPLPAPYRCSPCKGREARDRRASSIRVEVAHRVSLSRLAEERLGVETAETELLFLTHPVPLLQYLFTGGDPALLFPFVAILRAQGRTTYLCICSPWSADGIRSVGMTQQMTRQMEEKLIHAAVDLRDSDSKATIVLKGARS